MLKFHASSHFLEFAACYNKYQCRQSYLDDNFEFELPWRLDSDGSKLEKLICFRVDDAAIF